MIWVVWAALAISVLATCAAGGFAATRALAVWRRLRSVRGEMVTGLDALEDRAAAVAEKAEAAGESPELDRSVARLRESTRRLNVLRSALRDATDMVGRVTAVYPRK